VLELLRAAYGKAEPPPQLSVCDQLLFRILAENDDYERAGRALEILRTHFVDWNELRVSFVDEINEYLEPCGFQEPKALEIKRVLGDVYEAFNTIHLDELREEPLDQVAKSFSEVPSVSDRAFADVLIVSMGGGQVPATPEVARILKRVGLLGSAASKEAVASTLSRIARGERLYEAFYYLTRLGREKCLSESPKCGECPLLDICAYGKLSLPPLKRKRPR